MVKIRDEINAPSPDPAVEIQEGIRRTEAKMSATINEIQEKFAPANIKAKLKDKVRRYSLIGLVKANDAIRSKPVPAALVGAGVAWLLVRKLAHRRSEKRHAFPEAVGAEEKPAKAKKQPVDTMKTYINMAKIVIAVGSAISTYLMREREAGRSPFRKTAPEPAVRPRPWTYPPGGDVSREVEPLVK